MIRKGCLKFGKLDMDSLREYKYLFVYLPKEIIDHLNSLPLRANPNSVPKIRRGLRVQESFLGHFLTRSSISLNAGPNMRYPKDHRPPIPALALFLTSSPASSSSCDHPW